MYFEPTQINFLEASYWFESSIELSTPDTLQDVGLGGVHVFLDILGYNTLDQDLQRTGNNGMHDMKDIQIPDKHNKMKIHNNENILP